MMGIAIRESGPEREGGVDVRHLGSAAGWLPSVVLAVVARLARRTWLVGILLLAPATADAENVANCGKLGHRPCEQCLDSQTVYFPFNFCCIPESTSCRKMQYSCNDGHDLDRFGRCTLANLTVDQAVAAGCRSQASAQAILDDALKAPDLGSITRPQIEAFRVSGDSMTTLQVTDPETWGYRATDFPEEIQSMQNGKILSKGRRRAAKSPDEADFWATHGPSLPFGAASSLSQAFQMIATADSNKPMSQYASVALAYDVASRFGSTVYKFQMAPNSAILGLRNCTPGSGEDQIQVESGTPIKNLQRFYGPTGYWETYNGTSWVRTP